MRRELVAVAVAAFALGPARAEPPAALDRWDLAHPARVLRLPPALAEVSGLAVWDGAHLLAHGDEQPVLHVVRVADGEVVRRIRLGARRRTGDFEDLVLRGRHGFLVQSDGTLWEFTLDDTSAVRPYRHHASLVGGACEVESLAPEPAGDALIAACKRVRGLKGAPGLAMHRWTPRRSWDLRPARVVPWAALGGARGDDRFAASGMAPLPGGGWLLLDGPHARIAELAPDGAVVALRPLPAGVLPQAEGIALGPDGTLYVASEGHRGPGVIAVYPPRPGT